MKSDPSGTTPRRAWYLDNLKTLLTVLVIFHHAGQTYGDGGGWVYTPSLDEFAPWLGNFFAVNASFFMGLYFLIAGYFVPRSYDRHGFRGFVRIKLLHLGVPLVVLTALCSVATGRLEIGHLWFVEHLLVYSLLYALFRLAAPLPGRIRIRLRVTGVFACALAVSAATFWVRGAYPVNEWVMAGAFLRMEPAHLPQYVALFALGIAARRADWFSTLSRRTGRTLLTVGVVLALGIYLRDAFHLRDRLGPWWCYESFLGMFLSFGLVALFRFRFDGSTPLTRWLAANSYAAYLLHVFVVIGLQVLFDRVPMGGGTGKFLFIGVASTILSYVAAWALRRIPVVRRIV